MAEGKRIAMTTTVGTLKKDKKPKPVPPTPRFNLVLHESNDQTCPEYSYSELVRSGRPGDSASKIIPTSAEVAADGADDPFGDDDEDDKLKALARKFEDKYRPALGKKHRKKLGRLEDYIDLGMGYDENDPFIDNTDAYDELVPSTLTTQLGGFYINTGKLDFKEVHSESSDDEILDSAAKKRRRRLKDLDKDGKRRKRLGKDVEAPKKRGRKPLDGRMSKNKQGVKQPTVASLLLHHKAQMQAHAAAAAASATSSAIVTNGAGQPGVSVVGQPDPNLPNSSVTEAIESVINASRDADSNDCGMNAGTGSSDSEIATAIAASEYDDEELKLPDNLSPDLDGLVRQIKEAALRSEEGKCKFFSGDVNDMLLNIELKSRELACSQRTTVFAHLAKHLPCTKETLMKRAKKLRLDQEDNRLKKLMEKLKEAVDKETPALFEKFSQDCLAIPNYREELHSSDDEEEEAFSDKSSQEGEQVSNSRLPRKNFVWNDECRKRLCDVVRVKMKCYEVSKLRSQSAEDYLRHFLVTEVKQLWPKGWMKARMLYRESKATHSYLTNRPRKSVGGLAVKKSYTAAASVCEQINKTLLSNGVVQALSPGIAPSSVVPTAAPAAAVVANVGTSAWASGKSSPVSNPSVEYCRPVSISVVTTTTTTSAASNASLSVTPALPAGTTVMATAGTSLPSPVPTATASVAAPTSSALTTTMSEGFAIRLPAHSLSVPEINATVVPITKPADTVSIMPVHVTVTTTMNSSVPAVSISPRSSVVQQTPPPKSVSVLHSGVSKPLDSPSPPNIVKHHVDKSAVQLPRAATSVDSITVSSLLKQASATGVGSNAGDATRLTVASGGTPPATTVVGSAGTNVTLASCGMSSGGRKFSLLDFAEPVQISVDTPSPNDVLSQIIHASLADYPNSGNNKALATSVSLGDSTDFAASNSTKTSCSNISRHQNKVVGASVITSVNPSHVYKESTKLMNYKSQVSLLKNPTPSPVLKTEGSGGHHFPAAKVADVARQTSVGNAVSKVLTSCSLNAQHNTQVLHQPKTSSYSMHQDIISPSKANFTAPFQSTFEFNEAFERTLQGKEVSSANIAHQGLLHSPSAYASLLSASAKAAAFRKDSAPEAMLSTAYGRKDAPTYKESLSDQPLNFSTSRSGAPSSSPAAVVPNVSCPSPSSGGYSSRISPVPGGYPSPHKEGTKSHAVKSAHIPGRHAGLPPTSYGNSMANSSVRHASDSHYWGNDVLSLAVASALFGPEGSSSSSPSAYPTSSVVQATSSSLVTSRPLSHTTSASTVPCSSPSLANHLVYSAGGKHLGHYPGFDFGQQAINPAWRTSPITNSATPSPAKSAIYNRHYAQMLPTVTSSSSLPTFSPNLKLPDTAKSSALLQQPPYAPSRDPGISPTSYPRDQGSSY